MLVALLVSVYAGGSFQEKGCRSSVIVNHLNICALSDNKVYCNGQNLACSRGRHDSMLAAKGYVNFGKLSNGVERKAFQVVGSQANPFSCAIVEGETASERVVTCWGGGDGCDYSVGRGKTYGMCYRQAEDADEPSWGPGRCHTAGCEGEGTEGTSDPKWILDTDPRRRNNAYSPIKLPDNVSPETLFANGKRACVVGSDKKLYCWGHGGVCNLGLDEDHPDPAYPDLDLGATYMYGWDPAVTFGNNFKTAEFPDGLSVVKMGLMYDATCALFNDNTVRCWGDHLDRKRGDSYPVGPYQNNFNWNGQGPLGCGYPITMKDLLPVGGIDFATQVVVDIYAGRSHACVLIESGDVPDAGDLYCWGANQMGQTGASIADYSTHWPMKIDLGDKKVKMAALGYGHTCAIMSDDTVQCWGDNTNKKLGIDLGTSLSPVSPNMDQRTIHGKDVNGATTLGICPNDCDTCRCWDGDNGDLVPKSISAGPYVTCVVFTDGSMQCWGSGGGSTDMTDGNAQGSWSSSPQHFTPTKIQFNSDNDFAIPCDSRATCASFADCEHSSLLMDSAFCEGDENSCDVESCCEQIATCEGITNAICESGGETFYTVTKGADQQCIGNSATCDTETCCQAEFCDITGWGTDLPFVPDTNGNKITIEDKLDESSELNIKFTLATETCVDRKNWLGVTYHKLGTPVCTGGTDCSGKSEEDCTGSCQFRIPCLEDELDASLSDAIFGEAYKTFEPVQESVSPADVSLNTNFVIKVKTDQLTTEGAGDIYTAPTQTDQEPTGKLEFCVRPAVKAGSTEVLYREIVLRIHVGMGASFTVQVDSDSFQEGAVQNVDTDSVSITAEAFSCTASGDGYAKDDSTPTLKPNQLFTLCVIGSYTSIQCENIITLDFYQPRGESIPPNCDSESQTCNKDNRVSGGASSNPLLTSNPQNAVQVVKGTSTDAPVFKGCVVNARLDSNYFADVNPGSVTMTGTALLDFKSSTSNRRKLGELAHASQNLKMSERRALQGKQTAGFNLNFKLAEDEDPSKNRPQTEVDAASSSENYVAAALTAVAISAMM